MHNRRSCITPTILVSLLCLSMVVVVLLILNVPAQVESTFGPPSPSLDPLRRLFFSIMLFWQENDLTRPADPTGQERTFSIQMGESAPSVIGRLWREGLIRNPAAFRAYLSYTGLDVTLQAGNYKLSPTMTSVEIAHALQDATSTEVTFNILAGWRAEEIAESLSLSGLNISPKIFMIAVHEYYPGYSFSDELPTPTTVEGFLFPGEYLLLRNSTAKELVKRFLDSFEASLSDDLRQGFARQNLSLYEAVTLASIIEREAIVDEEMPLIASVFLNRLSAGMKLDSDPTVQYAIGFNAEMNTWWTNPLSKDNLKIDSPYNTYLYQGLPPSPIANPGLSALQAVAFPARTPYYYFRAGCDGSGLHLFAKTYEEHIQNECKR